MSKLFHNLRSIVFVLLIVLFLILVLQNTEVVRFEFLFFEGEMSRAILLLLFLSVGFLLGYYEGQRHLRNRQRRAEERNKRREEKAASD